MNTTEEKLVPAGLISDVATKWLQSEYVADELKNAGIGGRFSDREAQSFGEYIAVATLQAPTHGISKYPAALILDLGIRIQNLFPNVSVDTLPRRFKSEPCERIDTKQKLGIAVMDDALLAVPEKLAEYGQFTWLFYNSHHFGFSAYYANRLADQGYIVYLECTGSRGNQVIPLGGNIPRMGTNPICFAFPTKKELGFNFCADFSTSTCSMGKIERAKSLGMQLKPGIAFTADGSPTTDPAVTKSIGFEDHRDYSFGLRVEAIAALMGGIDPWNRGMLAAVDDPAGIGGSWVLTVTHPDFYRSDRSYDPIQRAAETLAKIVEKNGAAHLPGFNYAERLKRFRADEERIPMVPADYGYLSLMAKQANIELI